MNVRHTVRAPAVAGRFYPAEPKKLEAAVRAYLEAAPPPREPRPLALVAPHAAYAYSGAIAGSAYALLAADPYDIRRVVLIGPSHLMAFPGLALPECDAFATPLGEHAVDADGVAALQAIPDVRRWDRPHQDEHSLEVHLPFLDVTLGSVPVIPLLTGSVDPEVVAAALERVWTLDTLVVVSSDLSHHLPYDRACTEDSRTARAVEHLYLEAVGPMQACGCGGLRGLLASARRRGLRARCVDLRNSGDTSGSRARVVGYGAFGLWAARA